MAVKAAELLIEFTGSTVSLERASNRTNELILKNQNAIIRFQKTLEGLDRKTPDLGSKGARAAAGQFRDLNNELSSLSAAYSRFGGSGASAGIGALALGFFSAAKAGIQYKETLERLNKSFETLMGSQRAAIQHIKELQEFANRTPFEFEDVARASQRFQNMGLSAKDVIPTLTAIGNAVAAAGGGSEQIDRVSLAISQMAAKGKVSAEEMNQLAEAGVGGWKILEQQLGKSKGELMKMAEQGQISADIFIRAFRQAHEGGNAMQKQMETLSGASSTLKDYINQLNAGGFTPLHGVLRDVTVELAKMSTEGFKAERALVALASAVKNAFEAANPGTAGYGAEMLGLLIGGMPGADAVARVRAAQAAASKGAVGGGGQAGSWFNKPVRVPEEFQYKQKISDASIFAAQQARAEQEAQRKSEEAMRKARAEAERQAGAVRGLAENLRDLTIQNETFNQSEVEQQIALMRARSGVEALSGSYRTQAEAVLNLTAMQMRNLDIKQKIREEEERQKKEAEKAATGRQQAGEAFSELLNLQGAEMRRVNSLLSDPNVLDALTVQEAKMLAVLATMKDMKSVLQGIQLEPGKAVSNIQTPGKLLDLSHVKEDYWLTLRETWRENLTYMREDGQHILGQFFIDIQHGFKGATLGMLQSFASMLQQMAAQALASMVFNKLLGIATGFLTGGGFPMAGASKMGGSYLQPGSFVGGFAAGGYIPPGRWGVAGEQGPEPVFGGRTGATVLPNGSGSTVINFHVTAPGGSIPRETQGQLARRTQRALEAARGGAY